MKKKKFNKNSFQKHAFIVICKQQIVLKSLI